jgi:hypothetical protein
MLEAFKGICAFVFCDDEYRLFHLKGQSSQLDDGFSTDGLKQKQFLLKTVGDGFSALPGHGPSPHLKGFPSSETIEKF